jgi:cell division protein FtsW (lipid II flippase)
MIFAAIFLFTGCVILTLAPAVRFHTWQVSYRWEQWVGYVVWLISFAVLYHLLNRFYPDRDSYLLPIISVLVGWGLLTIFRLDPGFGFRQTIWVVVCLAGIVVGLRIPRLLFLLRRYKYIWLMAGLLLMLLTFFFGTYPGGGGPNLWLGCCGVYLQPSEFLKILLIVYLSAYFADSIPAKFNLIQLLIPTLIIAGSAFMILIAQRDLGTASLFIFLYTVIVYLASGKKRILLFSFITVTIGLIVGYLVFDVIQLRIEAWLTPWLDPNGRSYQIVQSIISIANGGLFGRGIGLGSPGVVPVAHSDFIYPAIVEETGLLGAVGLVLLFVFLTIRGFAIALHAPNHFQRFLAAGLTTYLSAQAILIMGGTIRLFPLTGVTLPFLSYGGSSLVTSFFAAFLLIIISNQAEDQPAEISRSMPYLFTGSVLLAGLVSIILMTSWWSIIRSDTLLARNDNSRRFISDLYVMRGKIIDRNNQKLAETLGAPGLYKRFLNYPMLSSVVGYTNQKYGQSGLEASMDSILRGIQENSYSSIFSTRFLYGQDPVGVDIRVSIDLNLQKVADHLLLNQTGGLILMNAQSGEVLIMSSSPTFDANLLDTNWEKWKTSGSSPLLNRVTQGQYPPGAATGGLILAKYLSDSKLSNMPPSVDDYTGDNFCAIDPGNKPTWRTLVTSGCTAAISMLTARYTPVEVLGFYRQFGLLAQPDFPIESADPTTGIFLDSYSGLFTGSTDVLISPLQMAVAASSLSNGGYLVSPIISTAFRSLESEWLTLSKNAAPNKLTSFNADGSNSLLLTSDFTGWEILADAYNKTEKISWYLAGTPPEWQGTPLILVIALENSSSEIVQEIGRKVFEAAITPAK